MNRIQKLSCFFKWVFAVILVGWPMMLFFIWFQGPNNFLAETLGFTIANFVPDNISGMILLPLSLKAKVWGFTVALIPAVVGMSIAFFLMRLFSYYERGVIFTSESIRHIRRVGMVMFVWALLNPIYQVLMSLALTIQNPVGERMIGIAIGADYFRNLITAGLVFLIAYIMQEGAKLKEEQALTI